MEKQTSTRVFWLRISISLLASCFCLMLVALWILSHWRLDSRKLSSLGGGVLIATQLQGNMSLGYYYSGRVPNRSFYISQSAAKVAPTPVNWGLGHKLVYTLPDTKTPAGWTFSMPHYLPATLAGLFAALPWLPWLRWRFSVRTLLIVTTLIALALGLFIWLR